MSDHITVTRIHSLAEHGTREELRFEGALTEDEVKTAISDFIEKRETGALMSQHPLFHAMNKVQRELEWIYDGQLKLAKVALKISTEPRPQLSGAAAAE
ncbi:hypothetical protein D3C71_1325710 [compost metagenome]